MHYSLQWKACGSNYDVTSCKSKDSFPEDPIERASYFKSLPNVLSCSATKNIGICNKHFPLNCPRVIKKTDSYLVPTLFLHQYLVLPKQVYLYKQLIHLALLLQPNQDTLLKYVNLRLTRSILSVKFMIIV